MTRFMIRKLWRKISGFMTRQNPDDLSEVVAQWTVMAEKWLRKILA